MSNTHCRFCKRTVKGIYLNCPACGRWLPPQDVAPGRDIAPEPYELVSDDTPVIQRLQSAQAGSTVLEENASNPPQERPHKQVSDKKGQS